MAENLQTCIALVTRAIEGRHRLRFTYHGKARIAEPQCLGISSRDKLLLRVHQIEGGDQPEPLFEVAGMADLTLLDERFDRPGPNYKRNDSAMRKILCQL